MISKDCFFGRIAEFSVLETSLPRNTISFSITCSFCSNYFFNTADKDIKHMDIKDIKHKLQKSPDFIIFIQVAENISAEVT